MIKVKQVPYEGAQTKKAKEEYFTKNLYPSMFFEISTTNL